MLPRYKNSAHGESKEILDERIPLDRPLKVQTSTDGPLQ